MKALYPSFLFREILSQYVSRDGELDDLATWSTEDLEKLAKLCKDEAKRRAGSASAESPK